MRQEHKNELVHINDVVIPGIVQGHQKQTDFLNQEHADHVTALKMHNLETLTSSNAPAKEAQRVRDKIKQETIDVLQMEQSVMDGTLRKLKDIAIKTDSENNDLKKRIKALGDKETALRAELNTKGQESEARRVKIAELNSINDRLRLELDGRQSRIEALENEKQALQLATSKQRQDYAQLEALANQQLEEARRSFQHSQQEILTIDRIKEEYKAKIDSIEAREQHAERQRRVEEDNFKLTKAQFYSQFEDLKIGKASLEKVLVEKEKEIAALMIDLSK